MGHCPTIQANKYTYGCKKIKHINIEDDSLKNLSMQIKIQLKTS